MSRSGARPPAATTYVLRNPRRVLPVALVLALVTALLIAVITPTNVFQRSADAYIEPLEHFTIVTPQLRNDFDERLETVLDEDPYLEKRVPAKMLWINTPAIIGEMSSPLLALRPDDQKDLMRRLGLHVVRGTLPKRGSDGAAIHEALLRARGLRLGDTFGRIVDPNDTTPGRFQVVGALGGGPRLGIIDFTYASIPDFVLARAPAFQVIYAKAGRKEASDAYLKDAADDEGHLLFRVVDAAWARNEANRLLRNLPVVIGFITAAVAVIVALVIALLNVIAFQARLDEFALYLAVGHRRPPLVRKLAVETTMTAVLGWIAGLFLGLLAVTLYDKLLLEPRAIVMNVVDPQPLLFSLMVPFLSTLVSSVVLSRRLHRMDPVAVLQRRGV